MITVQLAKRLMQFREVIPLPSGEHAGELQEIFNHPRFTLGSERDRHAIMQSSAYAKYKSELEYPWDHYFGTDLTSWLKGKSALDLGCFTGGRGVAWAERYGLSSLIGVDVAEPYMTAAAEFSRSRNVPAEYRLATAEGLPLEDAAVDAVLSFDVFEHVQDVPRALEECRRVLKPGGHLFVVFPSYYQPMEHHLSLVTRCPGLQYLFSGQTLLKAYCEILDERGETADWYRRRSANLEYWERGNTINGTTLARFRRYVRQTRWTILRHSRKPIGSIGRNASKSLLLKGVACLCAPFAYLPALEEVFLHRISFILQKTD